MLFDSDHSCVVDPSRSGPFEGPATESPRLCRGISYSNSPSAQKLSGSEAAFNDGQRATPVEPEPQASNDNNEGNQEPKVHPDDPDGYSAGFEFFQENDELEGTRGRKLEKRLKAPIKSTDPNIPSAGTSPEGYSVDIEPTSGTALVQIAVGMDDAHKEPQPQLHRELQTFLQATHILLDRKHRCRFITVPDEKIGLPDDSRCSFFPSSLPKEIRTEYHKRASLPWTYLDIDFKRRLDPTRRRVSIVCIEDDIARPFYLIEVERRSVSLEAFGISLLRHADWSRLDDGLNEVKFRSVLHEFILDGRPVINPQRHKELQMSTIPHPSKDSADALSWRLESWIQRTLAMPNDLPGVSSFSF